MEILGKIFGSEAKVKIMRLFLFNSSRTYDSLDVAKRAHVSDAEAKRQLTLLEKIGLLSRKKYVKTVSRRITVGKKKRGQKRKTKIVTGKRKINGWVLNSKFSYLKDLQSLLINTILLRKDEILTRLNRAGKVKLVVVSGVFIQNLDSRLDVLIVGERIQKKKISAIIKRMEAEIGKELQYASLETQDFKYRMSIYDKLVRDVLDYPHQVLLDKIGVKLSF